MFNDCPKFQEFEKALEAEGVMIVWGWSTKRHGPRRSRYDDTAFATFYGKGSRPAIGTAIILNYGKDGFGIFVDPDELTGARSTIGQTAKLVKYGHLDSERRAVVARALREHAAVIPAHHDGTGLDRSRLIALADLFAPAAA